MGVRPPYMGAFLHPGKLVRMSFINVAEANLERKNPTAWLRAGDFKIRPKIKRDFLFAEAAVRRLAAKDLTQMSIVSKAAVTQWRIDAELALELNTRGIHALIGSACSCGFSLDVERVRSRKPITRAEVEELLFALNGHFDTRTALPSPLTIVRGVLEWPARQYWIQPAATLVDTRWTCLECGDFAPARFSPDGTFKKPRSHGHRGNRSRGWTALAPKAIWSKEQLAKLTATKDKEQA